MLGDLPSLSRPYSFFAMTSFSATFSKDRSAYIRFRRLFSCSSSLIRFTSEASSPPYLAFHADPVVSPDLVDEPTSIGFFQDRHNLRFSELRLPHENLLVRWLLCQNILLADRLNLGGTYIPSLCLPNLKILFFKKLYFPDVCIYLGDINFIPCWIIPYLNRIFTQSSFI